MTGVTSGTLWIIIDVVAVVVLAGAILYGTMMWRSRSRNRALRDVRDDQTRELYRSDK